MKSDLLALVGAQLSAPLARIVFALVLVPFHPEGQKLVLVLALAELLSTFLTFGRNYLLSGGFNHHLTTRCIDKLLFVPLTVAIYVAISTQEQRGFWAGVVVMTLAITTMTMVSAWFLRARKLSYILPLNLLVYLVAAFATSYTLVHAVIAFAVWIVAESAIPTENVVARRRILPVLATLLAFASQRIDLQASALIGDPRFLNDVFQLNTLFLPLALLVRLLGNTALLRGEAILNGALRAQVIPLAFGIGYAAALYVAGRLLHNVTITQNIAVLALATVSSALTITHRESIAVRSRRSDFAPLFWFSLVGVIPGLTYMMAVGRFEVHSSVVFLSATYLAPRLLMLLYGWIFLRPGPA